MLIMVQFIFPCFVRESESLIHLSESIETVIFFELIQNSSAIRFPQQTVHYQCGKHALIIFTVFPLIEQKQKSSEQT